jgi:hypothetical protein
MLICLGRGLAPLAARLWRVVLLTSQSGARLSTESGFPLRAE